MGWEDEFRRKRLVLATDIPPDEPPDMPWRPRARASLNERNWREAIKRFSGDPKLAAQYLPVAQTLLGGLVHQLRLGGIEYGHRIVNLPDGTRIRVIHNSGINVVEIFAPSYPALKNLMSERVYGLVFLPRETQIAPYGWALRPVNPDVPAGDPVEERLVVVDVPISYWGIKVSGTRTYYYHRFVPVGNILYYAVDFVIDRGPVLVKANDLYRSFFRVNYKIVENELKYAIDAWNVTLSGNQFFFYQKDVFSYWGSPRGDLPLSTLALGVYSTCIVHGSAYYNNKFYRTRSFCIVLPNSAGVVGELSPAPVHDIYRNGQLFIRVSDTVGWVIGVGVIDGKDSGHQSYLLVATSLGYLLQYTLTGEVKHSYSIERRSFFIIYGIPHIEWEISSRNPFNGWEWKFSSDGRKMSMLRHLPPSNAGSITGVELITYAIDFSHSDNEELRLTKSVVPYATNTAEFWVSPNLQQPPSFGARYGPSMGWTATSSEAAASAQQIYNNFNQNAFNGTASYGFNTPFTVEQNYPVAIAYVGTELVAATLFVYRFYHLRISYSADYSNTISAPDFVYEPSFSTNKYGFYFPLVMHEVTGSGGYELTHTENVELRTPFITVKIHERNKSETREKSFEYLSKSQATKMLITYRDGTTANSMSGYAGCGSMATSVTYTPLPGGGTQVTYGGRITDDMDGHQRRRAQITGSADDVRKDGYVRYLSLQNQCCLYSEYTAEESVALSIIESAVYQCLWGQPSVKHIEVDGETTITTKQSYRIYKSICGEEPVVIKEADVPEKTATRVEPAIQPVFSISPVPEPPGEIFYVDHVYGKAIDCFVNSYGHLGLVVDPRPGNPVYVYDEHGNYKDLGSFDFSFDLRESNLPNFDKSFRAALNEKAEDEIDLSEQTRLPPLGLY